MKRELHTLYIKHDSQFKTLSKIALSQLILKIVFLKGDGTLYKQIEAELNNVLSSSVSKKDIEDAIRVLVKSRKLNVKSNRYFIHNDYKEEISREVDYNKTLLSKVIDKYFSKAESHKNEIENWFLDAVIHFFENYSFEWFHQITYKGKNGSNAVPNIKEILAKSLLNNEKIKDKDKEWLKEQFIRFIESEETDDNLLFWYYGISMFSSRLITARNYADGMTIEMFRDSKFILDTNILMILDLEEHELANSLESLETILEQLNIAPVYLHSTRDEYIRAMGWRRTETIKVFENFKLNVLKSSDCPFIQTALRRGCKNGEDIQRMFDTLMDIPSVFHDSLPIQCYDHKELVEAVEAGNQDDELRAQINETFKKRTKRDKRERPLSHDASIISGAKYLRQEEKCWIVTSDSVMKRYALEHCVRDESEIAIGLDVIIGLMAVNSGGTSIEASDFAPLFKNLIKYSLVPESNAFEVKDLAFILRTNIKINELPNDKVIEVAKEVKRLRISGEDEERVALYLRRFIEGDTVGMVRTVEEALSKESIAKTKRDEAEKERDIAYDIIRSNRRGELRDKYDKNLRNNRILFFAIPLLICALLIYTFNFWVPQTTVFAQVITSILISIVFGALPLFPINKKLVKKHSEYVNGIDSIVENEILDLKKNAKP